MRGRERQERASPVPTAPPAAARAAQKPGALRQADPTSSGGSRGHPEPERASGPQSSRVTRRTRPSRGERLPKDVPSFSFVRANFPVPRVLTRPCPRCGKWRPVSNGLLGPGTGRTEGPRAARPHGSRAAGPAEAAHSVPRGAGRSPHSPRRKRVPVGHSRRRYTGCPPPSGQTPWWAGRGCRDTPTPGGDVGPRAEGPKATKTPPWAPSIRRARHRQVHGGRKEMVFEGWGQGRE